VAPAAAQGLSVIAPDKPTWARWLGLKSGGEFVLGLGQGQIRMAISRASARECLRDQSQTPASLNVAARGLLPREPKLPRLRRIAARSWVLNHCEAGGRFGRAGRVKAS
jgi:hypothetical protein